MFSGEIQSGGQGRASTTSPSARSESRKSLAFLALPSCMPFLGRAPSALAAPKLDGSGLRAPSAPVALHHALFRTQGLASVPAGDGQWLHPHPCFRRCPSGPCPCREALPLFSARAARGQAEGRSRHQTTTTQWTCSSKTRSTQLDTVPQAGRSPAIRAAALRAAAAA